MSIRDRYTLTLTCPECQSSGVASIHEDDHRFTESPWLSVEDVSAGFTVTRQAGDPDETLLRCDCLHTFSLSGIR